MKKLEKKKQKAAQMNEIKMKEYYNYENIVQNYEKINCEKSDNNGDLELTNNYFSEEKEWEEIANLKNEKIQNDYKNFISTIQSVNNNKWLNPLYYTISQDINSSKNEELNNMLIEYLNKIYGTNEEIQKRRNNSKIWIYKEVENWLKQTCIKNNKEYSGK
uniref:STP1 protein n=1 Tax=Meloidogyne hapla TaxID=6305 RepID=A0A1I8B5Z4_MELHA